MINRLMRWLFGPRCACGHRAAKHYPSCVRCGCHRWHEIVHHRAQGMVAIATLLTKEEYDQLVSRH